MVYFKLSLIFHRKYMTQVKPKPKPKIHSKVGYMCVNFIRFKRERTSKKEHKRKHSIEIIGRHRFHFYHPDANK